MYLTSPRQKNADFIDLLCLGLFCIPRHGLKLHLEQRLQEQICSFGLILENLKKLIQRKAARSVLERHLWYLSDETVGLAMFSDRVTIEEKETLVAGLSREATEPNVRGDPIFLKEGIRLGDFATINVNIETVRLLNQLQIDHSFLSIPPGQWNDLESYQQGKHRVQQLRVVNNDTAERGVKLFEEFNSLLTHNEEDKQLLLQVIEANRKAVPTESKTKSVINALTVTHE